MDDGLRSTNLGQVPLSDFILVNRSGSTAVQAVADFAVQLVHTSALANMITRGVIAQTSLPLLQALPGTFNGQLGWVTQGANKGQYIWNSTSATWVFDTQLGDIVALQASIDALAVALSNEADERTTAISEEESSRQEAVDAERQARELAISEEANSRQEAIDAEAATRQKEVRATALVPPIYSRPGDASNVFTADFDGAPGDVAPLDVGAAVTAPDGAVWAIPGAAIVATAAAWRVEPGRVYRARYVFRRAVDTEDPANDAIRMALRWLKSNKEGLSTTILADLVDVVVGSGRLEYTFNFSTVAADNVDFTSPGGAVYVRPFLRTFGSGVTNVEVVEIVDISQSVDFSPDVSGYARQLAGLIAQVDALTDEIEHIEATPEKTPAEIKKSISSCDIVTSTEPFTLTVGSSPEYVKHISTLTVDRLVTLSTQDAYPGARFRITRTGPGAFNLSVGGLKNLATNTWADVVFDGVAWYLAAYGTL